MRAALALLLVIAAPAAAEQQVYRLSDADRAAAIASAAQRPEAAGNALLPDPTRDRILGASLYADDAPARDGKPHGEIGMFIGSGGARGIFGTIGAPIGDTGFAQFSFDTGRYPAPRYRPYRWNQAR